MTDRSLVFSSAMILAILAGRKFQMRRVLKPQPSVEFFLEFSRLYEGKAIFQNTVRALRQDVPVPFATGDRLWCREAFRGARGYDTFAPAAWGNKPIWYCADGTPRGPEWSFLSDRARSPLFMPRWASRLTLTVTDVRVQRIQEISEEDARAEGLGTVTKDGKLWKWGIPDRDGLPGTDDDGWPWQDWKADYRDAFAALWDSLNAKRPGCAWADNPWVTASTFTAEQRNIDAALR